MKWILFITLAAASFISAQTMRVQKIKGNVSAQIGTNENWTKVNPDESFPINSIIETGKNSSVQIIAGNINFTLQGSSALPLTNLKKMSLNDLILELAMEDMLNAPKKRQEANSRNTAVYGAQINGIKSPIVETDDFGVKRLNGAVQLAENGFKESAVVDAKETYRKYPNTNNIASFRIYFANILADLGLNEDAYDEFKQIEYLKLTSGQKQEVKDKMHTLTVNLMK